ncbi:MAG: tetratricopeptide repeat protein [Limnobacter sp.]|nr:tetratricopeptide repeat protein [Limnobacter sp.]
MKSKVALFLLPLMGLMACQSTPINDPGQRPASTQPGQQQENQTQEEVVIPITREPEGIDPIYEESLRAKAEREREIHLTLVQRMIQQDSTYAALAHLDAYQQKWGTSLASQRLRADALRKTRQFDQAEAIYQTLLSSENSSQAWYGLGRVAIDKGDLTTAVPRLEKAIDRDPLYVEAYSDLGLVYLLLNNKQPAYDTLMKASQLSNNDPKVLANLALWGLVFQDFDLARSVADRLDWSDETRGQVLQQASRIRERFQ